MDDSELIEAARSWLLECYSSEECQEAIEAADAATIRKAVARDYAGGWSQFVSDAEPVELAR